MCARLMRYYFFHSSSLEESSLCIVEPKAIPSPTLSINNPRIIPKITAIVQTLYITRFMLVENHKINQT